MFVGALGPRDLAVRDVAQEHVGEGPLSLALERGAALSGQEALALEGVEERSHSALISSERARPEDLADHRSVLESCLLLSREAVETGGDDSLQGFGKRHVLRRAALEVELRELLGVERVAFRPFQQRLLDLNWKQ
jgi:hypothetical protein